MNTIVEAKAFVDHNRIYCEDDWSDRPDLNRWIVYDEFKRKLHAELDQAGYAGPRDPAIIELVDALWV